MKQYDDKLDRSQILEPSNCGWVRSHRNALATGAIGAGKT